MDVFETLRRVLAWQNDPAKAPLRCNADRTHRPLEPRVCEHLNHEPDLVLQCPDCLSVQNHIPRACLE